MVGWVGKVLDKLAEGMVRRGQAIVETADRGLAERRDAVRSVRDSISEAMTKAEHDRLHGGDDDRDAAIAAANRANAVASEVADDEARRLIGAWKSQFDAIPKGWKDAGSGGYTAGPPGYPESAWNELRA